MTPLQDHHLFEEEADRAELARVHRIAHEQFGGGTRRSLVPDLAVRLNLLRSVFRLAPSIWDDQTIAHILFAGDEGQASAKFSKIKSGKLKLDEWGASMLAALVNYIVGVQPICEREFTLAQRLDVVEWILDERKGAGPWLSARDVTGDLLALAERLFALAQAHAYQPQGEQVSRDAHDCIVDYLVAPVDVAERDQRLVLQRLRQREATRTRFGATQLASAHPRQWKPLEFAPGMPLETGIPRRARVASRGWLVTVRDAASAAVSWNRRPSWVWEEGWDNTLRWWPSHFLIDQGDEIMAPSSEENTIVALPGLFQVFMFVEPQASDAVGEALFGASNRAEPRRPDVAGYLRLLGMLPTLAAAEVKVYTSAYTVQP